MMHVYNSVRVSVLLLYYKTDHLTEKTTNPETFWNNFDNIIFNTNPNPNPDPTNKKEEKTQTTTRHEIRKGE
jgi:hypothetical protein